MKDGDKIVQLANEINLRELAMKRETARKQLRLIIWKYQQFLYDMAEQDKRNREGGK